MMHIASAEIASMPHMLHSHRSRGGAAYHLLHVVQVYHTACVWYADTYHLCLVDTQSPDCLW